MIPAYHVATNVREDLPRHFATAIPDLVHTIILADDDEFWAPFAEALRLEGAHVIEASWGEMTIAILDCLARAPEAERALEVLKTCGDRGAGRNCGSSS